MVVLGPLGLCFVRVINHVPRYRSYIVLRSDGKQLNCDLFIGISETTSIVSM